MSRKSRPVNSVPPAPTRPRFPLGSIVAFAAGGLLTWGVLSFQSSKPVSPQNLALNSSAQSPQSLQSPQFLQSSPQNQSPQNQNLQNEPPQTEGLAPGPAALSTANWQYDRQNWSEAIAGYQQVIQLGIDTADVRTDLGNAFRFRKEPQKALEQYRLAQIRDPKHENSLFNSAALHAQDLNDPKTGIELAREYLRRFPDSKGAEQARGLLEDAQRHLDKQQKLLETLVKKAGPTSNP